jgi:hypothetical protein
MEKDSDSDFDDDDDAIKSIRDMRIASMKEEYA